jgi:nucleotide-binding universal stress UspA family protein
MYKKVLLAYDGSIEGRRALREGAKLAQLCRAEVFLLAVVEITSVASLEGGLAIPIDEQIANYKAILAEGVERLKALGFSPTARLGMGAAGKEIAEVAEEIGANLVVVVIVPPGRWRDGGSALSAPTWSSIYTAVSWWPKPKSATINLPS